MVRPGTQFNSVLGLVGKYGKYNRHALKSHDLGNDRHNKGVALVNKKARLVAQYQRTVSGMRRTSKKRPKKTNILKQLEAFDSQH
jgi:hypothetical protein